MPVTLFSFWFWSVVIFVLHFINFPAVNLIAWLVMSMHFMTAIEVFADTKAPLFAERQIQSVVAVCVTIVLKCTILHTTYCKVKCDTATYVHTQSREQTSVDTIVFVCSRVTFVGSVTTLVSEFVLSEPKENLALANVL
ncbi:MAG: carotenoid biosynthesis protein [Taibaiella sp.]|nr:carotenoid biosynthesis protein [Taibaiella sp.]